MIVLVFQLFANSHSVVLFLSSYLLLIEITQGRIQQVKFLFLNHLYNPIKLNDKDKISTVYFSLICNILERWYNWFLQQK